MSQALIKLTNSTRGFEEYQRWVPGTPAVPPTAPIPSEPGTYVDTVVSEPIVVMVYNTSGSAGSAGQLVPIIVGYHSVVRRVYIPGSGGSLGYPGSPAVPGHYETDIRPVTHVDLNKGWTGGARSIATLEGDGSFYCSIGSGSAGVVVGFGNSNKNTDYWEIAHGFYVHDTTWEVLESGTPRASGSYNAGDVLYIQRVGEQVVYAVNSVLVYSSLVPSTGTIFVDSSLYLAGDSIVDAALTTDVAPDLSGTTAEGFGTLGSLVGYGQNSSTVFAVMQRPYLGPLVGDAQSYNNGVVAGSLGGVVGEINGSTYPGEVYSSCSGVLAYGILTSASAESGGLQPNFAIVESALPTLSGFSIGLAGNCEGLTGILPGLRGYAANVGTAQCAGSLSALSGAAYEGALVDYAVLTAPMPTLFALGTHIYGATMGADLKVPKPTLLAYGASQARIKVPVPTLSASGTVTSVGSAMLTVPLPTLTFAATITGSASLTATLRPQWTVTAFAGATAEVTAPRMTLSATGYALPVGVARVSAPSMTLNASATVGDVVKVAGVLAGMMMPGMGVFIRNTPRITLQATATTTASEAYEGYSITLLTDDQGNPSPAVTHYTNFPFDRVVRFGGSYYGVAADGLYELGGDTFNGDPIVATVETAESDLGSPNLKHPRWLYMGGRMGADLRVQVKTSETENNEYTYAPTVTGARTRRVQLGRGIRARYFAFGFSNYDGDDFMVDELRPEVDTVRRRV